ncbi:MAG: NAD(P)H-hydrate dehydratase [Janthinobacterium lividum]
MNDPAFALALPTPAQMGRADRLAPAHGAPVTALMAAAGRAVARVAMAAARPCPTLVLCGPGSNGGDGYVAARLLARAGWPVAVAVLAPPAPGSDAAQAAARWRGPVVPFSPAESGRAGLVIDAVFGAGLSRDLDAAVSDTLAAARRVLAVDVPSGLDGATGQPRGRVAPAWRTVTFVRAKPGHLLLPGRALCGTLHVADIGMPGAALEAALAEGPRAWRNAPGLWRVPVLGAEDHKYTRGHVTVLGGAAMTGAARLAAGAARHGGAGLVTLAASGSADVYRAGPPGLIVSEAALPELLADRRRNAWVCGPGLGHDEAARALPLLLPAGREVVVDADALAACAGHPERLRGAALLTPHAGEFARVFGAPGPDRVAAVRAAAALTGAVVLLKGSDTIVASPDGRVAVNDSAPPWLATAGSGDVLAGLAASLLGQGMARFEAACAAVWLHGRAGALAGQGMLAEDLLGHVAGALAAARQGQGAALDPPGAAPLDRRT